MLNSSGAIDIEALKAENDALKKKVSVLEAKLAEMAAVGSYGFCVSSGRPAHTPPYIGRRRCCRRAAATAIMARLQIARLYQAFVLYIK